MKEKYKKISNRMKFLEKLGAKMCIKRSSLQGYFTENGTIPTEHKERFEKAIDLQLLADEEIRQIEVKVFEEI